MKHETAISHCCRIRRLLAFALLPLLLCACKEVPVGARLKPAVSFDTSPPPQTPGYAVPENWAALPQRNDPADVAPSGVRERQATAQADVFFIHPTTFLRGTGWNQDLGDAKINYWTDRGVLRNQASVFNTCCRIYAPRYRQSIVYAYMTDAADGHRSRDLAYSDVLRAFDYYLEKFNNGRPIIVSGHSQGAYHALRLLEERFAAKPLRERLVAAYLLGIPIPLDLLRNRLASIPLCSSATQTGCIVTFNTVGPEVSAERFANADIYNAGKYVKNGERRLACVNPLSWQADNTLAPSSLHLGAVHFEFDSDDAQNVDVGLVHAQCKRGLLEINRPEKEKYRHTRIGKDDFHVYDYSLFHMNLRRNAEDRVKAYPGR
jgi:hypothetical protein